MSVGEESCFLDAIGAAVTSACVELNGASMNERLETLKKARERMIEERDAHAKVLAAPFDRDKAERARNKFLETQTVIDALERAINAEERTSSPTP
jgi:hypothetical protein